jgi:hypothetical protein
MASFPIVWHEGIGARAIITGSGKGAEVAMEGTYIGGVDVPIFVEIHIVAMLALPNQIGHRAQCHQIIALIQANTFFITHSFALNHFFVNVVDIVFTHCVYLIQQNV